MGFVAKDTGQPVSEPLKRARLRQLWQRRSELTTEQQQRVADEMRGLGIQPEAVGETGPLTTMQAFHEDYLKPIGESLKSITKETALPLGMQLGAQAIGSRFGIPPSVSGAVGAAAGTYLNYPLGLAKPPEESFTGLPPELETPLATGLLTFGTTALTKPAITNLPGAQAAKQEMGAAELQKLESGLRTAVPAPSTGMYDALLAGSNPNIPMTPLLDKLKGLRKEYSQLSRNQKIGPAVGMTGDKSSGVLGRIKQYQDNLKYYSNGWPLDKLRNEMRALNNDIANAAQTGQDEGALRSMKAAMWESLEQSGTSSAPLKAANQQFMKEIAGDELADILQKKGMTFKQTHGYLLPEVNPSAIKNALKNLPEDSLITKKLKRELPAIYKTLDELASIPKLEAEGGISTKLGSPGRLIAAAGSAAIGGLIGGGVPGMAGGAAAGIGLYEGTAKLLMSPRGRAFLTNLIKSDGGHWTPATVGLITNAASQFVLNEPNEP